MGAALRNEQLDTLVDATDEETKNEREKIFLLQQAQKRAAHKSQGAKLQNMSDLSQNTLSSGDTFRHLTGEKTAEESSCKAADGSGDMTGHQGIAPNECQV